MHSYLCPGRVCVALSIAFGLAAVAAPGCADDRGSCRQDAIMCTDGTFVGRTGPDCTFDCSDHGGVATNRLFPEEREYFHETASCTGTPENPTCRTTLTFFPDGRIDRVSDDIVESGIYDIVNAKVSITVSNSTSEFTLSADETTLTADDVVYMLADG